MKTNSSFPIINEAIDLLLKGMPRRDVVTQLRIDFGAVRVEQVVDQAENDLINFHNDMTRTAHSHDNY